MISESLQIITTRDGSHTIFVPCISEHYHSIFGAVRESTHIFIQAGFNFLSDRKSFSVFEIGFGTGLNALLTYVAAAKKRNKIIYHAIEKHPLDNRLLHDLNYTNFISDRKKSGNAFKLMHQAAWNTYVSIDPCFTIHKIKDDFLTYSPSFHYDVVYFDAFAPAKQPEMWRKENFNKIYHMLNPEGILVSYCVQGQVKRDLKTTGFHVEILHGPQGKRHMLRARKSVSG